jgi:hypothetical protein
MGGAATSVSSSAWLGEGDAVVGPGAHHVDEQMNAPSAQASAWRQVKVSIF